MLFDRHLHTLLSRTRALPYALAAALCWGLLGCGGGAGQAEAQVLQPKVSVLRSGLASPWGLVFLPSGEMLVTERGGRLLRLSADAQTSTEITGILPVNAAGQGGLLGLALDPDFATTLWVYWAFSEPGTGRAAGLTGTAIARGRLVGNNLQNVAVLFRQSPKTSGNGHYGSRLVFARDKTLFITLGERQLGSPSQDLGQTLGKVVRIQRDGSIPADNPALGAGALPGIWSLGHRNVQGAALHPDTGELWTSEHGPQGGDEINITRAGANYGWPVKSYGCNYGSPVGDACRIGGGVHAPSFVEPLTYWVPTSVAPAGLLFYTGSLIPQWKGNLFSGSLAGQTLWRMTVSNNAVLSREALLSDLKERIRDVVQAPDGAIVLLTDSGKLLRLAQ
ncbi:Glucose/arabinose dehydrogenase, beta-propeller fold [Rhodoferax sp. OV413]|uniref:PQQ-dependent sugar dehydrogenase n=1 Tax=Rhodoferax sp. OV413 TaxID=1855285 RepID=UPI00087E28B6|nr:PQQ-dependent sugar dehydrogenase [Rhodoferax sp. OV413]SDN97396.1 Glucose/arabinose dehydrogenase, beta-propeller fold [Rhodoferax sp. OV413]